MSDTQSVPGIEKLVRVGVVSSVDEANYQVRVIFQGMDIVSGPLSVLQMPGADVSMDPAGSHAHETIVTVEPAEGHAHNATVVIEPAGTHDHDTNIEYWLPDVNDRVLCLYLPGFNADGFVLGVIP